MDEHQKQYYNVCLHIISNKIENKYFKDVIIYQNNVIKCFYIHIHYT